MSDLPTRRRTRLYNGLPALVVIALLIVGALFLTYAREDARLKPATGSARAMALAAESSAPSTATPRS
ncbi:hypothetical protein [Sphingomonas adhaesiva]|uniref:hypothetical protein n=1 Tax=Sphingomonas adhaesiva TaxID=28212 RepID=UPI002FF69106